MIRTDGALGPSIGGGACVVMLHDPAVQFGLCVARKPVQQALRPDGLHRREIFRVVPTRHRLIGADRAVLRLAQG